MEKRNGLAVDVLVTEATGYAEWEAGLETLGRYRDPRGGCCWTVGADKGYDTPGFVDGSQGLGMTPHVSQNTCNPQECHRRRYSRSPRLSGQSASAQTDRRDHGLGQGGRGRTQAALLGVEANQLWAEMTATAYNLIRIGTLIAAGA